MYYTYLLKSKKGNQIYIGSTNNLRKRLQDHNNGREVSTRRYMPWELLYYEAYPIEALARLREKRLKHNGNALRELKKRLGFFSDKSGAGFIALTSVLIIGAVVLVLGISLFHSALTNYSISTAYESGQKAAFLADFCLKEGVFKLKENIDYIGGEDIKVNNATCTINFVKQIDGNTKEISSLGRAGDQPHFSRSSQQIRYVIESSAADWERGTSTKLEIVGDYLRLQRAEAKVIARITDLSDEWNNYFATSNVEITEDGSLVLAAAEAPPEEPELGENGAACSVNEDCLSGNCQNNICCTDGQTCCSSDSHCDADECQDNCQKLDNYCDTTTDHYCKYTESSCNCTGSCKCDGGVCTGPWDYGTTQINSSWDRNCDGTVTKRWTEIETCIDDCDEGWRSSVPDCGISGTRCACRPFYEGGCIPTGCYNNTQECR
jgi:putative endonuclease